MRYMHHFYTTLADIRIGEKAWLLRCAISIRFRACFRKNHIFDGYRVFAMIEMSDTNNAQSSFLTSLMLLWNTYLTCYSNLYDQQSIQN